MTDAKTQEQEPIESARQSFGDSPSSKSGYSTAVKTGGTAADVIGRLLWVGVLLGAGLGLFNFAATRLTATEISAPQLAALAAESLTFAAVPYVIARAWDEVCRPLRWQ